MRQNHVEKDGLAVAAGDARKRRHDAIRTSGKKVDADSGAWKRSGGGRDRSGRYSAGRVHAGTRFGASALEAAQIANIAGGLVVMKRGTAGGKRGGVLAARRGGGYGGGGW